MSRTPPSKYGYDIDEQFLIARGALLTEQSRVAWLETLIVGLEGLLACGYFKDTSQAADERPPTV